MAIDYQSAVVTGGADGIGLAVARRLQQCAANVVIADIDSQKVEQQANTHGFRGVRCDVRSDEDVTNLYAAASENGEVDFVLANAGVAVGGRFEQIPAEEWLRLFDVNVHGAVRTINAFLPGMIERQRGRIVITGSSAGLFPGDGFNTPYAASKHALRAVAQGLATYCRDFGIDVHYLAPRLTDTAFPRSSVAWGRKGSRVTSDRDIGDDYDTVADVVEGLFAGIERGSFLISLTADTKARLLADVEDLVGDA